jgi:ABC-type sugar transport system ATPase subunit
MSFAASKPRPFLFFKKLNALSSSAQERITQPWSTGSSLTIRALSRDGRFTNSCHCSLASIVVSAGESNQVELAKALQSGTMQIRFDGRIVHYSEVEFVSKLGNTKNTSVQGYLNLAGVPNKFREVVLSEMGLDQSSEKLVDGLSRSERIRLAIYSSFFSKARIVVIDNLMGSIEGQWREKLASLISEAALVTKKVFIVSIDSELPFSWIRNSLVSFISEEQVDKSASQIRLASLKNLMSGKKISDERAEYIQTRPQVISAARLKGRTEQLLSESISNPHSEQKKKI